MKSSFRCLVQTLAVSCALVTPGLAQTTGARAATQTTTSGMITVVPNTPGTNAALTPTPGTLTTLAGAMDRTNDPQVVMGIKATVSASPAVAASVKPRHKAEAKAEGSATAPTFIENLSDSVIQIEKAPNQSGQVIEELYTGAKDAGDMTVDPLYSRSQTTLGLLRSRPIRNMRLLPGASAFAPRKAAPAPAKENGVSIPVLAVIAVMTAIFVIAMAAAVFAAGPAIATSAPVVAAVGPLAVLAKLGITMPVGAVVGGAVGLALGIKLRSTASAVIGTALGGAAGVGAAAMLSSGIIGAAILLMMISAGAVLGFGQNSLDQDEGADGIKNKPQWREPAFWIASAIAAGAIGMLGFSSIVASLGAIAAMFTISLLAKYSPAASWLRGAKDAQ